MNRKGITPSGNVIMADTAYEADLITAYERDEAITKYNNMNPEDRQKLAEPEPIPVNILMIGRRIKQIKRKLNPTSFELQTMDEYIKSWNINTQKKEN
jgi:hypothetical protein